MYASYDLELPHLTEERRIMSVADRTEAGSGRRYHFVETRCQSAPYLLLMGNVLNSLEISLYFPS